MTFEEALYDNEDLVFGFVSAQLKNNRYLLSIITKEELEQLSMTAFWKAWKTHDSSRAKLNTLFYTIVNNDVRIVIREHKRELEKQKVSIELNKPIQDEISGDFVNVVPVREDDLPVELKDVFERALRSFNPIEQKVIKMTLNNYSIEDIAKETGLNLLTLRNKQRSEIMQRLRKIIKTNYID